MKMRLLVLLIAIAGVLTACETVQTSGPKKGRVVRMAPIPDDEGTARSKGGLTLASASSTRAPVAAAAGTKPAVRVPAEPASAPDTSAPATTTAESAPAAPAAESAPATPDTSAATTTPDTSTATADVATPASPDVVADSSTVAATPTSPESTPTAAAPTSSYLDPATLIAANIGGFPIWLIAVVGLALMGALAVGMSGVGRKRDPYARKEREPEVEHEDAEPEMA